MLDDCPPGLLAPMLRTERDLTRARLAADDGDPAAMEAFTAAIGSLRVQSTPTISPTACSTTLNLTRPDDTEASGAAISEALDIAEQLGCQPLLGPRLRPDTRKARNKAQDGAEVRGCLAGATLHSRLARADQPNLSPSPITLTNLSRRTERRVIWSRLQIMPGRRVFLRRRHVSAGASRDNRGPRVRAALRAGSACHWRPGVL